MNMLHPVNRLSTRCTTSMACLLLSCRSSQEARDTLCSDVLVMDQHLVTDTTSTYQTTLRVTEILTPLVAALTTSPQGILCRVLPADFMQEATSSLPLMLKCSTRRPLRTNCQASLLPYLIFCFWFWLMHFLSNFRCKIIFMLSVNFCHQQDSKSLFKGALVT